MSSAIMSLLISHILTFIESEIIKEEPEIVGALVKDVQSLIAKLESLIASKAPVTASLATPLLNVVSNAAVAALNAGGDSMVSESQHN